MASPIAPTELRTPLFTIERYMEGIIDGVVPAEAETFASVAEVTARMKRLAPDLSGGGNGC